VPSGLLAYHVPLGVLIFLLSYVMAVTFEEAVPVERLRAWNPFYWL
jgi:hypothetical protein